MAGALPKRLEIYYKGDMEGVVYDAILGNWKLRPELTDEFFQFTAPADAEQRDIFKQ